MKRFIASLLIMVTIITTAGSITGCSNNTSSLSFGQWLTLVNDAFGMESYISDEPYFENVDSSNPYFQTVQIAKEWEVIDGESIDLNADLTWKQVVLTLVNAGNFIQADATEDEKIDCGIERFDKSIRKYWMNRRISTDDAVALLSIAQELWASSEFVENIEKYEYRDIVTDITADEGVTVIEQEDNIIIVGKEFTELEKDDVCILPDKDNKLEKKIIKVKDVKTENGQTIIIPSEEEVGLEEVYEELYIEETLIPTVENTILYDGNGNIVPLSGGAVSQKDTDGNYQAVTLGSMDEYQARQCLSNTHSFKVDGCTVKLGYNVDGKLDLSVAIESPNMLGNKAKKAGHSLALSAGAEISDLKVTEKIDGKMKWDGIIPTYDLKSAIFKVDYKVKEKYGITYSGKSEYIAAPKYSNGNGKFLTNFKRAIMKKDNGDVYGAETIASKKQIKICSLNIYSVGVAKVCLDVTATISVNGSIEISITESGSKGVEYKNGNIRFIKTNNKSLDAQAKAKAEATLGFGPALYLIGLKKRLVGLEIKMGIGASVSVKAHLADSQMHLIEEVNFNDVTPEQANSMVTIGAGISADATDIQKVAEAQGGIYNAQAGEEVKLHVDCCTDVKGYGILSIGLTDEAYLVDLLNSKKVNLSISILNEKNATFLNIHVDNFKWEDVQVKVGGTAKCTLNYIPFEEGSIEEITDTEINETEENIAIGEKLILSTMNVNMEVGEQYLINISYLPENYDLNEIVYSSKDENVATIDESGVIKAISEGCTIIYAKTKDGRHTAVIAVIVKSNSKIEYEGLKI